MSEGRYEEPPATVAAAEQIMKRMEEKLAAVKKNPATGPARVLGSGDFSIGGHVWPGLSKLIEECGEVMQVAGKLLGSRGEPKHWDGTDLRVRIEEELGDLLGAMRFVVERCRLDEHAIMRRAHDKQATFDRWHRGEK